MELPVAPLRIALVSGEGSDGLRDARALLEESGFTVCAEVYSTPLEGNGAARGLATMITRAGDSDNDLVLVVRGGGSRFSLWPFDAEEVARAIALARKPVITGIGHELDKTLADLVANRCGSTPTAAANEVVRRLEEAEIRLNALGREAREKADAGFRRAHGALAKARRAAETARDQAEQRAAARADTLRRNRRAAGARVALASAALAVLVGPAFGGGFALAAVVVVFAGRRRASRRECEARRHQPPMQGTNDLTFEQALVRLERIPKRLAETSGRDPEAIAGLALEAAQLVKRCSAILGRSRRLATGLATAPPGGFAEWDTED